MQMRNFLLALTLLTAAGCSAYSTSPANESIVGTYKLMTINGSPVPFIVVDNATAKLEFLDDQVTLTESGTFTQIGHSRTTEGGKVTTATITLAGTYTRTGTSIVLRSGVDGTSDYGTVDGKSLMVDHFGLRAAYAKQ
jgi:hypothetical protein